VTATVRPLPEDQLRRWSLIGIGGVIVLTIVVVAMGTALHWFTEDFGKTILQMLIPPLLSAFAVVVGYLFAERKRS
jgi:predicted tellurium resistance membrane protein TerC